MRLAHKRGLNCCELRPPVRQTFDLLRVHQVRVVGHQGMKWRFALANRTAHAQVEQPSPATNKTGAVHSLNAVSQDPAQAQLITHDPHAEHSSPRRSDVRARGDSPGSGATAAAAGAVPAALHGTAAAPARSDAHSRADLDTDPDPRPDPDSDPDTHVHAYFDADSIIVCSRCCGAYGPIGHAGQTL